MHVLTTRLDDQLFKESKSLAKAHGMVLSAYLRMALKKTNASYQQEQRYQALQNASKAVRKESQAINQQFSAFEGDDFE